MQAKLDRLKEVLKEMEGVVIAFSGGVDSSFLAKVAHDVLGDKAIAVTGVSQTYKGSELQAAKLTAAAIGIRHEVVPTEELENPVFVQNDDQRCYHCKHELFTVLSCYAETQNIAYVVEGSNVDDTSDFRPGMKAVRELNIRQPLMEAELGKDEIRSLGKELGLTNWNKPASACIASRLPYGQAITIEKLQQIDQAEAFLVKLGFKIFRVRHHGTIARIEVPKEDFALLIDHREAIVEKLKTLDFKYVSMDLQGYRTGSLNEVLAEKT